MTTKKIRKNDSLLYSTKRLIMRPLELSDYKCWLESQERSLPAVDKFDVDPLPLEKRTNVNFKSNVLKQRRQAKADLRYVWNIFLKRSGELVGFIDLNTISRDPHQMANLGYFITNIHRGNGYTKEALKKLIPSIFSDLGFHRLEAVIDLDNKASIALAKSSGLYREGIKKHYWYQNGRWEDQLVFIATPELYPRK